MGDEEKQMPFTVLVCGGGNAAQVATAMYAARYNTIAISLFADEAERWRAALGNDDYELTTDTGKTIKSKPDEITNDPSVAAKADAIILAVPSFAHGQYFEAFQPYVKPDTIIACMPARSGGDILLASKMGSKAETCIFVGFETLPWACRFTEWGRKATILGTKGSILAAVTPPAKTEKALSALQGLLGVFPNVAFSPSNLGISLRNPGAVIHPGVMYGQWCQEKWDGNAVDAKPLFYQGVEEFSEGVLLGLTGEVQAIRKKMEELVPGLNLQDAVDLKQWYLDCYAGQMTDTSSLRACMNTNPGYRGLTHPCKEVEGGKFMPDLKYRYLSEDVPTGMCFNKGLGELLGIPMPMTDKVLSWAQDCVGMSILVDGKMAGPDIKKTRAPQATGISTLEEFLKAGKIERGAAPASTKPRPPPPAETEEKAPFKVLVCGGGNAAQVATAMFAARYRTIAVSLFADEAQKWKEALGDNEYELTLDTGKVLKSKPEDITNDPSVATDADAIVLAVPSFAHSQYFAAFAPYMKPNTVVAVMPARSGGDIVFAKDLKEKAKDMIFMGFETLPWACRFTEWGRKATVLGTKGSILAAVTPPSKFPQAFGVMQGLLGVFPHVIESPNNLSISLRNPGAVIHPGVMYGRWCPEKWDGKAVDAKPLFYQGVEEFSEGVLLGLTGEVQAIRKKMEEAVPGLNLKDAVDLKQWYLDCYAGQMTDTSSLRACMNTNPGYRGLTHPCKETDPGKFMPDLRYRYLMEDVPTGMCFNKGLAEILGVPTPMTDKVLAWAQAHIGMNILVDGKMAGPDLGKTRAPQASGITTLAKFLAASAIEPPAPSVPRSLSTTGPTFRIVFLRHGESVWNQANIFTGWADVDLTPAGDAEAIEAGKCLKQHGFKFDIVFTSVLKRAIRTAWQALMNSDNYSMPVINNWRLNERHYGALQGLNKAETAAKHGDAQVKIWRRSYDIPPPPIDMKDPRHPANDPLYRAIPEDALPGAESLKLTVERVMPFWMDTIAPCVRSGRNVLVTAHGNSLRAICKYLEKMSEEEVLELNIPTACPLVYEVDARLKFLRKYYLMDPEEVAKKVAAVANQGKAAAGQMIFQLGTNNWQRPMRGGGDLEFAPGSGVLHEAHHNAFNMMPGTKSYSMYPSQNQGQPTDAKADYKVFELEHAIPICESASPNSSKRWHGFSEAEFKAYADRLEAEVYDYMKACEAREGKEFTMVIAHHSFLNPLVCRNVIQRRVKEGKANIPLFCFVHGTALKMYRWELGGKNKEEFPMRFHKMIVDSNLFNDQVTGVNACFVISQEQKGGIAEIFPTFPQERVIVAPNGINVVKFKPREKTLAQVLREQTREVLWPAVPAEADMGKYTQCIAFVGKAAEWKRQAALLHAAAQYEKAFPNLATLCVGIGPDDEIKKLKDKCEELGLKNTFLLGARSQDILAEIYTVSELGCFPSFKEPFGLVFVECMACKTPVIGANSGGPKDFVSKEVGELVAEPPETTDLSNVTNGIVTLGNTLNEAITRALNEGWKAKKGETCIKLAHDRFTVEAQVSQMLIDAKALP